MKAKLAGLALLSGMSLAASAAQYNFTPIIEPRDTAGLNLVINLGNQLTMDVTDRGDNTALFTFRNAGGINAAVTGVYFDDTPSNLFSNVTIASQSPGEVSFHSVSPAPLPGGSIPTFNFTTTQQFNATSPTASNGVNNSTAPGGESLTLAAALRSGHSFTDVVNSLNGGNEANQSFLRVGLRLTAIENLDVCGCAMSFLDKGTGTSGGGEGSPPPPIPEPQTYGMLLAGLGLVSAMVRRGRKNG
ncbi:MAG TPA: PEP-CTERM sorting domain-containing protein [Rhodocyclaceae bacterium]|nr:PEP-CTERM sorting domain-containing protein [Rhodocyclaceae bacterium]